MKNRFGNHMKKIKCLLIPVILMISMFVSSMAAYSSPAPKYKWVARDQYYYFYNKEGKMLKNGIYLIRGKKYYFDAEGRQRTGWRKVGGGCYFFRDHNAASGYMVKNSTVDGIYLNRYGRAVLKTARNKAKLPVMLKILAITDRIIKPGMKSSEKLKTCFLYARNHFRDHAIPDIGLKNADWDLIYAKFMLDHGYGNCYCFAALFAYMANAIGYSTVYAVNDTGHGWTEIGGKFYDVEWSQVIGVDKCYAVPASLSGKDRRPNWAANRVVLTDVNK